MEGEWEGWREGVRNCEGERGEGGMEGCMKGDMSKNQLLRDRTNEECPFFIKR